LTDQNGIKMAAVRGDLEWSSTQIRP